MKCQIAYIYALCYKGRPFYIGKTVDVKKRFRQHKSKCFGSRKYEVYDYIKSITTKDEFYKDIVIKTLKAVSILDIDKAEMQCIKYCIDRNVKIFNNCVKTNSYLLRHVTS